MSPAKFIGFLHFLSGSDDISFLNGFSKDFCYTKFKAHNDEICPEKYEEYVRLFEGDHNEVQKFFTRILIVLYYKKFRSCFGSRSLTDLCSDDDKEAVFAYIREESWHKTLQNPFPATTAITLHCKRLSYILKKNGNATDADVSLDAQDFGWKFMTIENKKVLCPEWDTTENIARMNAIKKQLLKKCSRVAPMVSVVVLGVGKNVPSYVRA